MLYTASPPASGDPFSTANLLAEIGQHSQIIPVADATARAQLVTALAGQGFTPTTSNPLYVWQTNAAAVLVTTDGTSWNVAGGPKPSAVCSMTQSVPSATVAAENLTIARQTGGFTKGLTSSYSLIVPTTGWYTMSVAAFIAGSPTNARAYVELIRNDADTANLARFNAYGEDSVAGTFQFELTAGDGIKVQVYQAFGTTRTINGSLRMIGQPTPLW